MKILHLISGKLGQGGAEQFVLDLADAQSQMGHDVTICSFRKPDLNLIDYLPRGVSYHTFHKHRGPSLSLQFKIVCYIKKNNFDVVNCHLPAVLMNVLCAMLLCKKTRFFYTIHNNPRAEVQPEYVRKIRHFIITKNICTYIGISDRVSIAFEDRHHLYKSIPIIYNGRKYPTKSPLYDSVYDEMNKFRQNENVKIFIAVGRVSGVKNYPLLLESFMKLIDKNIVLVILGSDSENLWETYGNIPTNVYYMGSKNNVCDYLFASDCFVMSSFTEGLPISILEAYSAGLPVVSTPVGGIPDVVTDGVNGFLSKDLSVDSFVAAIKRYLTADECSIQRMRETNKQLFAERFDIRQTAKQYIELYESNR